MKYELSEKNLHSPFLQEIIGGMGDGALVGVLTNS